MRLWSVPCIDCSSSCFGVLYATTVDWQMIQRYLRHLSFYSAPSCLRSVIGVLLSFSFVTLLCYAVYWNAVQLSSSSRYDTLKTYFFGFQKNPCEFLFYISIIVFLGNNLLILYGEITTPPPPTYTLTHTILTSSSKPITCGAKNSRD